MSQITGDPLDQSMGTNSDVSSSGLDYSNTSSWTGSNKYGYDAINSAYQNLLGRSINADQSGYSEYYSHANDPNYYANIAASPEAQAYAASKNNPTATTPPATPPPTDPSGTTGNNSPPPAPTTPTASSPQGPYGDPAYNTELALALKRISDLSQPQSFPLLDQYTSMLQTQEQQAQQRAQTFADQMTTRIGQLNQPLLSDADSANIRAQAENNINAERDSALKTMRDQAYTSGFAPTSGLIAGNERSIDEQYTNAKASVDSQLAENAISTDEARRNEATQLQGLVAQALEGGDVASLQAAASAADMENQAYNINQQRAREALTTSQVPVDLSNMGLVNAEGALGSTGSPASSLSSLMPLLQMSNSNNNSNAAGFGSMFPYLMQLFGQNG